MPLNFLLLQMVKKGLQRDPCSPEIAFINKALYKVRSGKTQEKFNSLQRIFYVPGR